KPSSVPTWLRRMDAYLRTELPGLRPFVQLEKLRASKLATAWKKGARPRTHEVLAAVDVYADSLEQVCDALGRRLGARKAELFAQVRRTLGRRKHDGRLQPFDDLLLPLRAALRGSHGRALAARLRTRWHAALVDEFQGPEPAQCGIVRRIWGGGAGALF